MPADSPTPPPSSDPIVITPTHLIRPHLLTDLPSLTTSLNDHSTTRWMSRVPFPYTLESARQFYESLQARPGIRTAFVIIDRTTGEAVGGIEVTLSDVYKRTVELGYWLARPSWGQGIITTLVLPFLQWAFRTLPLVNRVEAVVHGGNVGSMRVLEKVGFREEGVLKGKVWKEGEVRDLHVWGLLKEEFEGEQRGHGEV
jgi:ribosomal-protein-alanine N-acetyltransferase